MFNCPPRPLYPEETTPVPTEQEAGWTPKALWTFWKTEKPFVLPGFEPWTVQQLVWTLHRLSYPVLCISKKPAEKMYKEFWFENLKGKCMNVAERHCRCTQDEELWAVEL
jgi:hypothetical protein